MSEESIDVRLDPDELVSAVKIAGRLAAATRGGVSTYLRESDAVLGRLLQGLELNESSRAELAQRASHLLYGQAWLAFAALYRAAAATSEPGADVDVLALISELEDEAQRYFADAS